MQVLLELDSVHPGQAFLRTNLGNNAIRLQEIIALVEEGKPVQGRDWQDLPMQQVDDSHFQLILPLHEVGYFEFKAFFVEDSTNIVYWPRGENASVKVGPAKTVCANTIYNAFVRQFGSNKSGSWQSKAQLQPQLQEAVKALDEAGCTVIPPSGTFRDLIAELDFIMLELGFRIIQLLPVHPIPTTFARMGRFGSPFAPLDFFSVDPAMAVFDRTSTPMEQFIQLVDEVHARNGLLFLDIPADHTGWGSVFQVHNPEWFVRNPDGTFASPGAWGVIWEDLCKLDYQNRQLWQRMAEVFLHWCHAGVDGFRCDAGYMIPAEAWDYLVAKVRQEYPDTVFFLEGLGGRLEDTSKLLSSSNLNWAYSELFQQYSTAEIRRFLDFFCTFSPQYGLLVHFAETHDNERLGARSRQWAEFRVRLCALLAPAGAFGIANGAEWLAGEKIDVHGATSLNWGSAENLVECLQKLLALLHHHPAFSAKAKLVPLRSLSGNAVSLLRQTSDLDDTVLVLCNPDVRESVTVFWHDLEFAPAGTDSLYDLVSDASMSLQRNLDHIGIELPPLSCCCLTREQPAAESVFKADANQWQMLRDLVLDSAASAQGVVEFKEPELVRMAEHLHENPREFLRSLYQPGAYLPLLEWMPGQDERRVVPLPPGHFILLCTSTPFLAHIRQGRKCLQTVQAVPQHDGRFFALFQPLPANGCLEQLELQLSLFEGGKAIRHTGHLALLPQKISPMKLELPAAELHSWHCGLASTDLGGYTLARAIWGTLYSQYDALLAANLDCKVPIDRTILLNRCRAWVVCRDYSRELNLACQNDFAVLDHQSMRWRFTVPSGLGQCLELSVTAHLSADSNTLRLFFSSVAADSEDSAGQQPSSPISLIIRPDIDDRSQHAHTKAFQDAERRFPSRLQNYQRGFTFLTESGHQLRLECCCGQYFPSPEWQYQVQYLLESSRGLEDRSDLFSPGYFRCALPPGATVMLLAAAESAAESGSPPALDATGVDTTAVTAATQAVPAQRLPDILRESLGSFIVRRDDSLSLIAGYPWFLDWGRDTLISLRGLLAAGLSQQCRDIIRQYASYEQGGTLPNMIRGRAPANADTSDAPLWLFIVVRDYIQALGEREILTLHCGERSLLQVLLSIAENYLQGTANGIKVCEDTALVFSPAHFTWMDTNHPAATPREGYPVEIQALWIAALEFLVEFSGQAEPWSSLAARARESFLSLYPASPGVGLADCLHARAGVSARLGQADDACRPNQLLAITLGVVQDQAMRGYILHACQKLLVPGGIRSLADQRVNHPLPVYHQGRLLNDPQAPYWGEYSGDEDTRRKPAYHNGTAWGWLMPSYSEALLLTYGPSAKAAARALLHAAGANITRGCLGHLPEIFAGDSPHLPRGCFAQAWSESELFRVLALLSGKNRE
ncbi:MAG: glycogen debranching protein [Oligosphaeraceae bacterium]|nr:glycogen debranching protein [Oligosphaeraceae bacterium]